MRRNAPGWREATAGNATINEVDTVDQRGYGNDGIGMGSLQYGSGSV